PNLNGCSDGEEFWVHCMVSIDFDAKPPASLVRWFSMRSAMSGRIFIFVARTRLSGPSRHPPEEEAWLIDGRHAQVLKRRGLKKLPRKAVLGVWDGGPKNWDWRAIRRLIA